jgi:hypothetical protein
LSRKNIKQHHSVIIPILFDLTLKKKKKKKKKNKKKSGKKNKLNKIKKKMYQ